MKSNIVSKFIKRETKSSVVHRNVFGTRLLLHRLAAVLVMITLGVSSAWAQLPVDGGSYFIKNIYHGNYLIYSNNKLYVSDNADDRVSWTVSTRNQNGTTQYAFYLNGSALRYKNGFDFGGNVGQDDHWFNISAIGDGSYCICPIGENNQGNQRGWVAYATGQYNLLQVNWFNQNTTGHWTFIPDAAYSITVQTPSGGTVASNATTSGPGATITLTATPDDGYVLSDLAIVDDNGNDISSSVNLQQNGNTATFTMPESNVTVVASFVKIINGEYVIYNGTYYLGGTNNSAMTSFDPKNCIWTGVGAKLQNGEGRYLCLYLNTAELTTSKTSSGTNLTLGGSESGTTGRTVYYDGRSKEYYLYLNGNNWSQTTNSNYAGKVVFKVTTYNTPERQFNPTISGADVVSNIGTTQYVSAGEYYCPAYNDYVFYNGTHHYFSADDKTSYSSEPQSEDFDYAWSLSSNASGHVTIDSKTGEVSYNSYYNVDTDVTITLVATSKTSGKVLDTATKTVTFQYQRVNPTGISADESKTLYVGNDYTIDVTLTPNNAYRQLVFTSADESIATVDGVGKVTARAIGTTTITIQARKMDGSTSDALTATLTLTVKDKVAKPEISFAPVDGTLTALTTLSCATTDAKIYYTIDGSAPDPSNVSETSATKEYTAPFSVNNLQTVKAIAVMTGDDATYYDNSDVAELMYSAQKVPTPTINVRGYEVTFSCDEPGVTYYYTYGTNPADPTTTSSSGNSISSGLTSGTIVKVFATKTGFAPSEVASKKLNTAHIVYLDFTSGNDGNDGSAANKAKKTWKGAYSVLGYGPNAEYLLKGWKADNLGYRSGDWGDYTYFTSYFPDGTDFSNTVDNNIIYLVGDVTDSQISDLLNDKTVSSEANYIGPILAAGVMKPATISGKYATSHTDADGTKYARITLSEKKYTLNEDTRFEYIEFYGGGGTSSTDIQLAYYDLEMGEHIMCHNFLSTKNFSQYHHGYKLGVTNTAHILFYGGLANDARFTDATGKELQFDKYLPHPDGYKITIRSGYFSTISPGGTQWNNDINGTMGSPNTPVKCTITVDIDRAWNDAHKTGVLKDGSSPNTPDCDVAVVIAGVHEGNMYGDVDIIVKSGRIDRVVNGTFGANSFINGGYPADSYFGRANILIDPRDPSSAERSAGYTTKNSMVAIRELYGGGLGRFKSDSSKDNQSSTYFYGKSSVTINGGTFQSAIYASGAGGVNGVGDDTRHTNDGKLPYWSSAAKTAVSYGGYDTYKNGTKLYVHCRNTDGTTEDVDLVQTTAKIEIHGGVFGSSTSPIEGIFGGGYGFVDTELIDYNNQCKPNTRAGAIFAPAGQLASSILIDGDTEIYGNVFGAGRGDNTYKTAKITYNGDDYTNLGQVSGNVELTIGGEAKIHGSVYGAGQGIDGLTDMARMYGNTTITVGEKATITGGVYGGGENGSIDGGVSLSVLGDAVVGSSDKPANVHGGGLGKQTRVNGNVDVAIGNATDSPVIYGDVYGGSALGMTNGLVSGQNANTTNHTNVTLKSGTIHGSLYGGGLGTTATVTGNPIVTVSGGSVAGSVYGGGALASVDGNTTVNLTGGTVNDVYGGGLGRVAAEGVEAVVATVGNATVNIGSNTGTETEPILGGTCVIYGSVFGCNNLNGTPNGTATVNVYKTNARPDKDAEGKDVYTYHINAIYGGGNKAAYDPTDVGEKSTLVHVYGCGNNVQYVYGGGNAASTPATHVLIEGGTFDYVFGGGNGKTEPGQPANPGANVGYYTDIDANNTPGTQYGTGKANTEIHDGVINHLFGGSNIKGNIRESAITQLEHGTCDFFIGEAYAAGNEAYMDGTAKMNIGCIPGMGVIYGGSKAANINNDVQLTITSGTYGQVFGGNNVSGTISGTITVNIEETGCYKIVIGEVYGGGNQAAYAAPTGKAGPTVNAYSFHQIGRIFGGGLGAGATVTGDTHVNVQEMLGTPTRTDVEQPTEIGVVGEVYGGGNQAAVNGTPHINIGTASQVQFVSLTVDPESPVMKDVLGANIQKVDVTIPKEILGLTRTEDDIYHCSGNVYGGGKSAAVTGMPQVTIGRAKQ